MLGAIKIRGNSNGPSLFRLLSRRWQPLTRAKRTRPMMRNALALEEDDLKTEGRAWIGAEPVHQPSPPPAPKALPARRKMAWSPWLWTK
jgi:hypothetical protein